MCAARSIGYKNLLGKSMVITADASLDGLAQQVIVERERDELRALTVAPSAGSTSTTMVVEPFAVRKNKKRGAGVDVRDGVVAPEIALPNARLAGNKPKSVGAANPALVMRALYDDAHLMTSVLCAFAKFTPFLHLIFDADGMSTQVLHSTRTVSVEMQVPAASFFRYDNLLPSTAIAVTVSTKAIQDVGGGMAEKEQSMSFMYHQCGREDEPLHIQLNPRDNNEATAPRVFYHLPHCEDEDDVQAIPERQMQYEVRLDARRFLATVRKIAKLCSTVVLMMRQGADGALKFEMGGLGDNYDSMSISFGHAEAEVRTDAQCTIYCLEPGSPASHLSYFLNHRLLPPVIEAVASFGSIAPGTEVVLGLGVKLGAGTAEDGGYVEEPVHVTFPIRDGTSAPFSINAWICPETVRT